MRCQGSSPHCARDFAHDWRNWPLLGLPLLLGAMVARAEHPQLATSLKTPPAQTVDWDWHERAFVIGLSVLAPMMVGAVWWVARQRVARVREQLALKEQREQLIHLSRVVMLGELSGSIAHELNQPLTSILSNAQAAQRFLDQERPDLDEVREILKDIVDEDRRAGEVIKRLRTLLKKGEVQRQALDMNETVGDVLRLVRNDLINHRVSVRADLAPGLPPVLADRVEMQQVLVNLITNGYEAMLEHSGPDEPRVIVVQTNGEEGERVRISVSDLGPGIPKDRLDRIFESFYTTKGQGMGIGLTVCRTIVAAHGGRLWATNNPDRGATLHFTVPIAKGMYA